MRKATCIISLLFFLFVSSTPISAHQPRIVEESENQVVDPIISKAYYGTLTSKPHIYTINALEPFDLYVGILVPVANSSKKDVRAQVYENDVLLATIGGVNAKWKTFFEPFGQSTYWDGGEYKSHVQAGTYKIIVSSPKNDSEYSLAIGEKESFSAKEGINALRVIPDLKRNFFKESPISFIKSPFGWGYILVMYVLSFIFGFLYRLLFTKFAKRKSQRAIKNLGITDRTLRLAIGCGLLLWAITSSWNPILLFGSGFAVFEAVFSWCFIYSAIGKNTCPLK